MQSQWPNSSMFCWFTLWPFRASFPCSPALQDGKGASTFGHQTLRISYVDPATKIQVINEDLSGESHLIVSHSHVSRIIHGNQDRLGIPCWEGLVSLGANASIQNMRFSWIWGFQLASFWSWEMPSIYRSFHDVPSFPTNSEVRK